MHQDFIQVLLVQNEEVGEAVGHHVGRAPIPASDRQQAGVREEGVRPFGAAALLTLQSSSPALCPPHAGESVSPASVGRCRGGIHRAPSDPQGPEDEAHPGAHPPPAPSDLISPNTDPALSVTSTDFPSGPPKTCTCPAWMMYISRPISP